MTNTPDLRPDLPPPCPGLWRAIARGLVERALRILYAARAPGTPARLKLASLLVAVYFVFPFDLVSDLLPLLGFGDDLLAVSLLGWRLSRHADDDIRYRARARALAIIP